MNNVCFIVSKVKNNLNNYLNTLFMKHSLKLL
jgi:hypothetical protein